MTVPRLLVVDDEFDIVTTLRILLELEGYAVSAAGNGADGLALARELRPQLVITDLMMPVMNGLDLCRHLRDDASLRATPIIVCSALPPAPADPAPYDVFLRKPVTFETLLGQIRRLLGPAR